MEKERKSSAAYLMQLAGKYKLHLLVSALFGIASALCSFIPYVMVYRSILVLLGGEGDALRYGLIAAAAIAGKFLCSIVSGTFSHIGAFNTLYNVRTQIIRHIAKVNWGFSPITHRARSRKSLLRMWNELRDFWPTRFRT